MLMFKAQPRFKPSGNLCLGLHVPSVQLCGKLRQIPGRRFVVHDVDVVEPDCLLSDFHLWDLPHAVRIQMGEKLVSIAKHDVDFLLEHLRIQPKMAQQIRLEGGGICDNVLPRVLPAFIRKELASFQYADIYEIAVDRPPEIDEAASTWIEEVSIFLLLADAVVGKIAGELLA